MPPIFFSFRSAMFRRALISVLLAGTMGTTPALAQKTLDGRVDRLEKEMQAVQRKVFPGVNGAIIAPDVAPDAPPPVAFGSPASAPIADLTARVAGIESQLARVTGEVEENGHRLQQLEARYAALKTQLDAQAAAAAAVVVEPAVVPAPVLAPPTAITPVRPAPGRAVPGRAVPAPATRPDAGAQARTEAVAAIEKTSTGNAAMDSYTYGFRLWTAKYYPEAQAQLQDTVDKYGNDPVASRAANLLGRAWLDDGKPTQAAKILFENYRTRPKGDRAAESLAWVGEALIQLNRLKDACLAYDELKDTFGNSMPSAVRDMMAKGRVRAKCGA